MVIWKIGVFVNLVIQIQFLEIVQILAKADTLVQFALFIVY